MSPARTESGVLALPLEAPPRPHLRMMRVRLEVLLQNQEGTLQITPSTKVSTHGTPYDDYL